MGRNSSGTTRLFAYLIFTPIRAKLITIKCFAFITSTVLPTSLHVVGLEVDGLSTPPGTTQRRSDLVPRLGGYLLLLAVA